MYGYGNSMFLATHGILARSGGGGAVDPDAQAFITAASITDPTQQSAINQLVVDLKGYSIWTKFDAIYPMVGGGATAHSYNLKNTANFQLTFSGGWTHSSTGAKPNGTNAFANTNYKRFVNGSQNSGHLSYYSRTNATASQIEIGAVGTGNTYDLLQIRTSATTYYFINNNPAYITSAADSDSRAFYVANRQALNDIDGWRNGTKVVNDTGLSATPPNFNCYLGALNNQGVTTNYSTKECAFASIGQGLTDTEAANFYTAVQAFQTTLGRSIGTQTVSDADAQAFVTNAGIVDQVEANAINNLVIGLKADSLWTKMKAVYPFVGSSSSSTSYNLKNTAQYQITWNGGVTHASTGVTFNGSNGYGNTNFAPNSVLTANSNHVSLYSRTAAARTNGLAMDFGQGADVNVASGIYGCSRRSNNTALYAATNVNTTGSLSAANTNGSGMFVNSITSATSRKIYRNAVTLGTLTTNISQTLSAAKMYIAAFNNNDSGVLLYSDYQASFFSIGDGLDDTDATNLNSRVTTFQTALNRNV
jgi:hypothetical protein